VWTMMISSTKKTPMLVGTATWKLTWPFPTRQLLMEVGEWRQGVEGIRSDQGDETRRGAQAYLLDVSKTRPIETPSSVDDGSGELGGENYVWDASVSTKRRVDCFEYRM